MQIKTGAIKTLEKVIKMLKTLITAKATGGVVSIGGITGTLTDGEITLQVGRQATCEKKQLYHKELARLNADIEKEQLYHNDTHNVVVLKEEDGNKD